MFLFYGCFISFLSQNINLSFITLVLRFFLLPEWFWVLLNSFLFAAFVFFILEDFMYLVILRYLYLFKNE